MTSNYSKNLYVISLSLLLFSIFFLANSDETTLNAYETTTSTTTSTESDVNTYDVNNSDVNIPDVNNSDVNISKKIGIELFTLISWCGKHLQVRLFGILVTRPFFENFRVQALVSSSVSEFFLFSFFKDNNVF